MALLNGDFDAIKFKLITKFVGKSLPLVEINDEGRLFFDYVIPHTRYVLSDFECDNIGVETMLLFNKKFECFTKDSTVLMFLAGRCDVTIRFTFENTIPMFFMLILTCIEMKCTKRASFKNATLLTKTHLYHEGVVIPLNIIEKAGVDATVVSVNATESIET